MILTNNLNWKYKITKILYEGANSVVCKAILQDKELDNPPVIIKIMRSDKLSLERPHTGLEYAVLTYLNDKCGHVVQLLDMWIAIKPIGSCLEYDVYSNKINKTKYDKKKEETAQECKENGGKGEGEITFTYIVLEYIRGKSIDQLSITPLMAEQVYTSIRCLHNHGVYYGYVKPQNIIWDGNNIRLIGFGYSGAVDEHPEEENGDLIELEGVLYGTK